MELNKEILITSNSKVKDIQSEFSASYPFLKIEFHVPGNKSQSNKSTLLDPATPLLQLANAKPGKIDISGHRTVAQLSGELAGWFGVNVKMSRKSGSVWSTISISDGWTLQSQNVAGEYISSEMGRNTIEPTVKV